MIDALEIEGQVAVRVGSRKRDRPKLFGRQPVSVASNSDDAFCCGLARSRGSRVLFRQAQSPSPPPRHHPQYQSGLPVGQKRLPFVGSWFFDLALSGLSAASRKQSPRGGIGNGELWV